MKTCIRRILALKFNFRPRFANSILHRIIQPPALVAAGTIHIGVIGVNIAALAAAEHAVLRVRRAEATPMQLGKNPRRADAAQRQRDVKKDEDRKSTRLNSSHGKLSRMPSSA